MKNLRENGETRDMDERTNHLLNTDIDTIVKTGKSKNRKKFILLSASLLLVCIVGALLVYTQYYAKKEALYAEATKAIGEGDYVTAQNLLEQIGEYKDSSKILLEKVEFAVDLTSTSEYANMQTLVLETLTPEDPEATFGYDLDREAISISNRVLDFDTTLLDEPTPEIVIAWASMCESADQLTDTLYDVFSEAGYSQIKCILSIYDEEWDTLLYEAANGRTTFNILDVEDAESQMYEEVYEQIVAYVDTGDYQEACDYWDSLEGYYSEDYEDLQDYVKYAEAVKEYQSEEVPLEDALNAFEEITPGFKDIDTYIDEIKADMEAEQQKQQSQTSSSSNKETSSTSTSSPTTNGSTATNSGVIYGTSTNLPETAIPLTSSAVQGFWKSDQGGQRHDYTYFLQFSGSRFARLHNNNIYEEYTQFGHRESIDIGTFSIDGPNIVVTYQNHSIWNPGVVSDWKTGNMARFLYPSRWDTF